MTNADWKAEQITLHYDDPSENHHKFYRISVLINEKELDYRVVYEWGRIGTNGQSQFKPARTEAGARNAGIHRETLKRRKGYTSQNDWEVVNPSEYLLAKGGINPHAEYAKAMHQANDEQGVTFAQMQDTVAEVLNMAVGEGTPDPVDAAYNAALMNAKLAELRKQMELLEAEAEFANTAVRARM